MNFGTLSLGLGTSITHRSGSHFPPTNIPNLQTWLDASTGTLNDQSGNGNHFAYVDGAGQPSTGIDTLNGKNVFTFAAGDSLVSTQNVTLDDSCTIIMVVKNIDVANSGNKDLFRIGSSGAVTYVNKSSSNGWAMFNGSVLQSPYDATGDTCVLTSVYNGANSELRRNGVVIAQGGSGILSTTGLVTIGNTRRLVCGLAEFIIYNTVLDQGEPDQEAELNMLESGLMAKWGQS